MRDCKELKKKGFIKQPSGLYTARIRVPVGNLDSKQLRKIADISDQMGLSKVHLTTRQDLEIRDISYENIEGLIDLITVENLKMGPTGYTLRNVIGCGGNTYCQMGLVDSESLGYRIDEMFSEMEFPERIRIAVSGCPNSCTKPQENDIGLIGKIKPRVDKEKCKACGLCIKLCKYHSISTDHPLTINYDLCMGDGLCAKKCPTKAIDYITGYSVLVGGKIGREPQLGYRIIDFIPESEEDKILSVINNVLYFFKENAKKGERIGNLINRIGIEKFKIKIRDIEEVVRVV